MVDLRITRPTVVDQFRNLIGSAGQSDPSLVTGEQVISALIINDSTYPVQTSATFTGDVSVINSATANKTAIKVQRSFDSDGRAIINKGESGGSFTAGVWRTVYTVTTGKTFYMTDLGIAAGTANETVDYGTASTVIGSLRHADNTTVRVNFLTPVKYTTAQTVQLRFGATGSNDWFINGWEE